MSSTPWLSVLIPTYNGSRYLPEALESVVAQDSSDLELLAVDDGSSDNTIEILNSFSDRLPIRTFARSHVGNWVTGVATALTEASGEFVSILHQDDGWYPGRLRTLRRMLEERRDAAAALHPVRLVDERGRRLGTWRCPLPVFPRVARPELVVERLVVQNFVSIVAPVFRRDAALAAGGLNESLWYTADWDLWLRMARSGPFLYSREALGFFRVHPSSQTFEGRRNPGEIRKQLEAVLTAERSGRLGGAATCKRSVFRVADFSAEVNVALFGGLKTGDSSVNRLVSLARRMGFAGWCRFLRNSRILERAVARARMVLRAGGTRE